MNLFSSLRQARQPREAVPEQRGPSARRVPADAVAGCDSYAPGHQMHYIHQGQALRSPSIHADHVLVDGNRLLIVLDTGEQLSWHHHDPERLASILGLFPSSRLAYPKFHALRVGPYWFNCAPGPFTPCEIPAGVGDAS